MATVVLAEDDPDAAIPKFQRAAALQPDVHESGAGSEINI